MMLSTVVKYKVRVTHMCEEVIKQIRYTSSLYKFVIQIHYAKSL